MKQAALQVTHVYEREAATFENSVNEALRRIVENGDIIGDIKYISDPASSENRSGGFGALLIYEQSEQSDEG